MDFTRKFISISSPSFWLHAFILAISQLILPVFHQILYKLAGNFFDVSPAFLLWGQSLWAFFFLHLVLGWSKNHDDQLTFFQRGFLSLRAVVGVGAHLLSIYCLKTTPLFFVNLGSYIALLITTCLSVIYLEKFRWSQGLALSGFFLILFADYQSSDFSSLSQLSLPCLAATLFGLSSLMGKWAIAWVSPSSMTKIFLIDMTLLSLGYWFCFEHWQSELFWLQQSHFLSFLALLGVLYALSHSILSFLYLYYDLSLLAFFKPFRSVVARWADYVFYAHYWSATSQEQILFIWLLVTMCYQFIFEQKDLKILKSPKERSRALN